ncbi:Alpha/beta hydrolase family protein [Asanoa hainanensis]|uniref:Alpha/beta hydrolase family protein n=1 Tax=Asanoa hainanensis TaxID=560556 RepID=A0A239MSQ8_9ACTN|nr:alpha/beta hydrolase [Asanoa hainanensis]SNT44889.1 Alpha/beta hydrolase family protein [Asanoa hainanensis]
MRRGMLACAAVAVLLLAGCGSDDGGAAVIAPSPTGPVPGAACPGMASGAAAKPVHFGDDGATNLAGLIGGKGTTGVVLAHQAQADLCQWILGFNELIGKGYRVLAFDFHGHGSSESAEVGFDEDVVAAAATLRSDGATSIVLVGASMGGTFSIAATPKITPPVAGVISVSAPLAYGGVSAQESAPKLTVPALFLAQQDDGLFGDAAKQFKTAATASPDAQLLVTPGATHGVPLVIEGGDTKLREAFFAFLAKYAPV